MQKFLVAAIIFLSLSSLSFSQNTLAGYDLDPGGRKIQLTSTVGKKLILTAYGESIIRVQPLDSGTQPFSDDRYGMLETHDWPGSLLVEEEESILWVYLGSRSGCRIQVNKQTLAMSFYAPEQSIPFLREKGGTEWSRNGIATSFVSDPKEKFTGLGHGYFGRETSLDLSGRAIQRNYGRGQGDQAPLIVPFFLSNKGYGLFLNSSFPNKFIFNRNNQFEVSLTTRGYDARMDYFVIWGADMAGTLDQYTQLTGRPRMPRLAYFGLAMSDKAQEAQGEGPQSDENWWKEKILAHREAGYPLDHVVNDNQWRAGGGTRLKSVLDWERERYPDPAAWRRWTEAQGLIVTVDFNRGMAKLIPGWKPEFNIPLTRNFDIVDAAPDFTHPELRRWFWEQFWEKAARGMEYPADAFWIDEFDQLGGTSSRSILADGRPWYEVKNLWFHLIAETLVRDGWDKEVEEKQRPFVWIRGATAGTQRYATLWTGDIQPNDTDMAAQVVSMQLAGLSGFPFWSHDNGGFYDGDAGPTEELYRRWAMAFGAFTPFWKPHGMGESRWPLDRDEASQESARFYTDLRYSLLPYIYSVAQKAHATGYPMARAMLLEYPHTEEAWQAAHQFFWGPGMLVAPQHDGFEPVELWLPPGSWYDYYTEEKKTGGRNLTLQPKNELIPLYIPAGAIIPRTKPALSTAFWDKSYMEIHVYLGADGQFDYYEDDGVTERFRTRGESVTSRFTWDDTQMILGIAPFEGNYQGVPRQREIVAVFHGLGGSDISREITGTLGVSQWDEGSQTLRIRLPKGSFGEETLLGLE